MNSVRNNNNNEKEKVTQTHQIKRESVDNTFFLLFSSIPFSVREWMGDAKG